MSGPTGVGTSLPEKHIDPAPLLKTLGALPDEYLRRAILAAIEHALGVPAEHEALAEKLRKHNVVRGFRDPLDDKPDRLANAILGRFRRADYVVINAVLRPWIEAKTPLLGKLLEFAAGSNFDPSELARLAEDPARLSRLSHACRAGGVEHENDDLRLLAAAMASLPLDAFTGSEEVRNAMIAAVLANSAWGPILETIRSWAPDSSAWSLTEQFTEAVRHISAEKSVPEPDRRGELKEALEALCRDQAKELQFLRLEAALTWSSESPPVADVRRALENVRALSKLLASTQEVRGRACPTIDDEDQRTAELAKLRAEANQLWPSLLETFAADDASNDAPEAPPEPVAPTVVSAPAPPGLETGVSVDSPERKADDESEGKTRVEDEASSDTIAAPSTTPGVSPGVPTPAAPAPESAPIADHGPVATAVEPGPAQDIAPDQGAITAITGLSAEAGVLRVRAEEHVPEEAPAAPSEEPGEEEDLTLASTVLRAADRQRAAIMAAELQRRWLMDGRNVAGYIAARVVEQAGLEEQRLRVPSVFVPSWLCQFATILGDERALKLDVSLPQFYARFRELGVQSVPRQRFFMGWLWVGLLGEPSRYAIQVCQQVDTHALSLDWIGGGLLRRFLMEGLVAAGRRGKVFRLDPSTAVETLQQKRAAELLRAGEIQARKVNYQNRFVSHYWHTLVGSGGPVQRLLSLAKRGPLVETIPGADEVARQVDGWNQIVAAYRNNVLMRLDDCLGHLSTIRRIDQQLGIDATDHKTQEWTGNLAEIAGTARELAVRVAAEECPSAAALDRLAGQLQSASGGEAR